MASGGRRQRAGGRVSPGEVRRGVEQDKTNLGGLPSCGDASLGEAWRDSASATGALKGSLRHAHVDAQVKVRLHRAAPAHGRPQREPAAGR